MLVMRVASQNYSSPQQRAESGLQRYCENQGRVTTFMYIQITATRAKVLFVPTLC